VVFWISVRFSGLSLLLFHCCVTAADVYPSFYHFVLYRLSNGIVVLELEGAVAHPEFCSVNMGLKTPFHTNLMAKLKF